MNFFKKPFRKIFCHQKQKKSQSFKQIIVAFAIACVTIVVVLSIITGKEKKSERSLSPPSSIVKIDNSNMYTALRHIDVFGSHFLMLRHNPTGQRLIFLAIKPEQRKFCKNIFEDGLSVVHFSLLVPVFKHNSGFKNRSVIIKTVSEEKRGVLKENPYQLAYKYYLVSAGVDGQPEEFAAYMGKILENEKEIGLIFTFNSRDYVSLEPFYDILKVVKAQNKEKAGKAE